MAARLVDYSSSSSEEHEDRSDVGSVLLRKRELDGANPESAANDSEHIAASSNAAPAACGASQEAGTAVGNELDEARWLVPIRSSGVLFCKDPSCNGKSDGCIFGKVEHVQAAITDPDGDGSELVRDAVNAHTSTITSHVTPCRIHVTPCRIC